MKTKHLAICLAVVFGCMLFAGCGFKLISETDYIKFQAENDYQGGRKTKIRVLVLFDNQARQILAGRSASSAEDKKRMEDFRKDLAIVNQSLPDGQKILDPDGKLVRISMTTPYPGISPEQEQTMVDIVSGNSTNRSPEVGEAIVRLGLMMSEIRDNFDLGKPPRQL